MRYHAEVHFTHVWVRTHTPLPTLPVGGEIVVGAHSVMSEQPLRTILSCFWKTKHYQIQLKHVNCLIFKLWMYAILSVWLAGF